MKKIIALLIVSTFLFSCTNNNIETKKEKVNTGSTQKENTPLAKEDTNTGTTKEVIEVVERTNTGTIEEEKIEETTTESGTEDEKMLETEVNDLLNEFIDSLDNYDK